MLNGPPGRPLNVLRIFAVAVLVVALCAPAHASDSFENQIASQINAYRTAHGLKPLRHVQGSGCSDARFAERRARRMARNDTMVHYPGLRRVLRVCKSAWVGENIAVGFVDSEHLVDAWHESAPHRKVMRRKHYTKIAVAVHESATGRLYVSTIYTN